MCSSYEYGQIGELQTLQGAVEDGSSSNAIGIAVAEDRRGSNGVQLLEKACQGLQCCAEFRWSLSFQGPILLMGQVFESRRCRLL